VIVLIVGPCLGLLFAYGWLFGVLIDNSVKTNIIIREAPDGLESSYA